MRNGGIVAVTLLLAGTATAQQQGPNAAGLTALLDCQSVPDSATRLACFDRRSRELRAAIGGHDVELLVSGDPRSGYGLPRSGNPPRQRPVRPASEPAVRTLDTTVASASPGGNGLWVVKLAEGGTWTTLEADRSLDPRAGQPVHIRRGALGSYVASFGRHPSVGVRRLR